MLRADSFSAGSFGSRSHSQLAAWYHVSRQNRKTQSHPGSMVIVINTRAHACAHGPAGHCTRFGTSACAAVMHVSRSRLGNGAVDPVRRIINAARWPYAAPVCTDILGNCSVDSKALYTWGTLRRYSRNLPDSSVPFSLIRAAWQPLRSASGWVAIAAAELFNLQHLQQCQFNCNGRGIGLQIPRAVAKTAKRCQQNGARVVGNRCCAPCQSRPQVSSPQTVLDAVIAGLFGRSQRRDTQLLATKRLRLFFVACNTS